MIRSVKFRSIRIVLLVMAIAALSRSVSAAENSDSIERMKKDIFFLASDECEGRGVETTGINMAAEYIAARFKVLGLKPALADGSYFQPFTVSGTSKLGSPNSLVFTGPLGQEIAPAHQQAIHVSAD